MYCLQMEETSLLLKRKPVPLTHIFNPLARALEEMDKQDTKKECSLSVQVSPRGMCYRVVEERVNHVCLCLCYNSFSVSNFFLDFHTNK